MGNKITTIEEEIENMILEEIEDIIYTVTKGGSPYKAALEIIKYLESIGYESKSRGEYYYSNEKTS